MVRFVDLLPVQCAGCGVPGASPCRACAAALRRDDVAVTDRLVTDGPDSVAALLRYDDASRPFITAAKNRGAWSSFGVFAPLMAARVRDGLGADLQGVVVTWAPTTAQRRAGRGFDHARILARPVARALGLPCRGLLRRSGSLRQTGRSAAQRLQGPRFEAIGRVNGSVVVVDDVVTTGATLRAAADALRSAGATSVHGVVLARTPLRG